MKKILGLIIAVIFIAALTGCNYGGYNGVSPGTAPYDFNNNADRDNANRTNNQSNEIIGYNDWASPGAFYDTGTEAAEAR